MPNANIPRGDDPGPSLTLVDLDPALLSTAIEAARRALRRMDDKDIPAKLRDIASRSGRLPTPLAKRLLAELDASEWLRAEALAEMKAEGDSEKSASVLFLERADGWLERVETLVMEHRGASERSEVKRLESELRRALARAGKLEQKLATAERKQQEAASGVEDRLAAAAASHRRSQARQKTARVKLASQVSSAEREVERLTAENSYLRQKVEEARIERGKATPRTSPNRMPGAWSFTKPADLARQLDDINRRLAIAPVPFGRAAPLSEPTRLEGPPAGIRPDRAEAIVWLLGLPGLVTVAIDGWNAAHLLKSPPVPATRNRIIEAARRIILASAGKRLVTAVFDSSQVGESFSADDVKVTFAASADEELIEMANRDATTLVVITSDRRVREAVEGAGGIGLWSEALIDWLKTGGRNTFKP
jgi:hypothetical protein